MAADAAPGPTGPIVHIGYHKTGTTWFQECLYPAVRNRHYIARANVRAALLDSGALHFDGTRARELLGEHLPQGILCEENLTGGLHNGGLAGNLSKDIAYRLAETCPDAQIVIFVRDQADAIASAYLQYVKGGGTRGVHRYLFNDRRLGPVAPERDEPPGFRFEHFDYARLVEHYDRLFGADRVHVFRYEDFRADPPCFIRGYARRFGLDVAMDALDFGVRNPALSRSLLWAARGANLFTRRAVRDKHCLIHIPGWYRVSRKALRRANASGRFGRPLRSRDILDGPTLAMIRDFYRAGNAALARRLGESPRVVRQAADRSGR